jgi:glycosyltransferase involved in cell wall biosynthesis
MIGNYDPEYTSNKLTIQGFKDSGAEVIEVNAPITVTTLNTKAEMGWLQLIKRVAKKYRIVGEIINKRRDIAKSNLIYVGYPGHFDVIPAWIVAKLFHKKLVFNPLLIFYTGFTEEQSILSKSSVLAKLVKFGEGLIYRMCDLIIADTPYQQEFMERIFKVPANKIRTVALGADDKFYPYTPYENTSKKINITYYGLYSPIHGVEYIIQAAEKLRDDHNIHFDMIGNRGQTFDASLKMVHDLKLKNISFYYDIPQTEHIPIAQS